MWTGIVFFFSPVVLGRKESFVFFNQTSLYLNNFGYSYVLVIIFSLFYVKSNTNIYIFLSSWASKLIVLKTMKLLDIQNLTDCWLMVWALPLSLQVINWLANINQGNEREWLKDSKVHPTRESWERNFSLVSLDINIIQSLKPTKKAFIELYPQLQYKYGNEACQ